MATAGTSQDSAPTGDSPMTVLLVDDDRELCRMLAEYLAPEGFKLTAVHDGDEALYVLGRHHFDLIVLDVMLPRIGGLDVLRALRQKLTTPVLMLTARGEEVDRVVGLELGADDYVTKPFSPKELVARVAAIERRTKRQAGREPVVRYGGISIDHERHLVSHDGEDVTLTAKEFLLLDYFIRHAGRVLSRQRLLTDVWGYQYEGGTRTVDVHVRRLRRKLPSLARALSTVHQFGYKLIDRSEAEG